MLSLVGGRTNHCQVDSSGSLSSVDMPVGYASTSSAVVPSVSAQSTPTSTTAIGPTPSTSTGNSHSGTSGALPAVSGGSNNSSGQHLMSVDPMAIPSEADVGVTTKESSEWSPPYPRLCAYHDCHSLASAWGLGPPTTILEAARPTGASQAQSPSEDDGGDGKSNELLASCPAFRNELGNEPIRRLPLSRLTLAPTNAISLDDEIETWQREHTAAEAGILEDVSNVYLGGRLCAVRQPKVVIEPQDVGSYYFRHCFSGRPHINYFGTDEQLGPIAASMIRENSEYKEAGALVSHVVYRLIIRISDLLTLRVAIPEEVVSEQTLDKSNRTLMRELLELVCPQIHFGALRPAIVSPKVEEMLVKIDEQPIYARYKVGILYCKANQSTEEQMYNNEVSSPALEEFLDFIGHRVRLKGFDGYKGGLDTKGDTTGEYSIFTEYHEHEIMFHVSTMLPFTPNNRQQLSRKRHIGNDMVTIIFQEPGALPFSPITVRSHFQHVFIVVRVNNPCKENVSYQVAVSRVKDVPAFGPPIPPGAVFQKSKEFHEFMLTKIINAENAVHRSKKFAAMAARTRREALKDLAENYVTAHPNEGPSRIAKNLPGRFLGGSVKRKERPLPKPVLGPNLRGALGWAVEVQDNSFHRKIKCVFGVSAESIVLLEVPTGNVVFATPTHSIIGWAVTDMVVKIYYDHGEMLWMRVITTTHDSVSELNNLLKRLEAVTNGELVRELTLRKTRVGDSLGFHIQEEGVVTDVEMYQTAWKTGLRQGSRIVEMEGIVISTMSLDQMTALLEERNQIKILIVQPAPDGTPRRGCEDPNCPAVKGQEEQVLTPDTFAKQPLTYQEMLKMRHKELTNSPQNSPSNSFEDRSFTFGGVRVLPKDTGYAYKKERSTSIFDSGSEASTPGGYKDRRKASPSVVPPIPPRTYKKYRIFSNSMHDQLCEAINTKTLDRTQSEEVLGPTLLQSLETDIGALGLDEASSERHLYFESEVSKYQWLLQKLFKEKKELELLNEQLKTQLAMEKRAHDAAKRQVQLLQAELTREASNPPELDDHL